MSVDPGYVVAAVITTIPATFGAAVGLRNGRKLRTNHGKNIGEHVEEAALAAAEAKLEARRVRVELAEYKVETAASLSDVSEKLVAHAVQDQVVQAEILKRLPESP